MYVQRRFDIAQRAREYFRFRHILEAKPETNKENHAGNGMLRREGVVRCHFYLSFLLRGTFNNRRRQRRSKECGRGDGRAAGHRGRGLRVR